MEEYRVYLLFDNGKNVHNLRFSTNLYDYDGSMTFIRFYDDNGKFALDAYFDKADMRYDASKGKVIVPPSGIKILANKDDDDCDFDNGAENDEIHADNTPLFHGAKVLYMSFSKRLPKNLHYILS